MGQTVCAECTKCVNKWQQLERDSPGTNTFITSMGRLAQIVENRKGKTKLHQPMRQYPTKCIVSKHAELTNGTSWPAHAKQKLEQRRRLALMTQKFHYDTFGLNSDLLRKKSKKAAAQCDASATPERAKSSG